MKTNHYFDALPNNYRCVYTIDAKDKKTTAIFILVNVLLMVLSFLPCAFVFFSKYSMDDVFNSMNLAILGGFILSMFLYIVLHELTHGLFYKIYTHEKLTFGLTLTVAYCGVPKLYVKRKASIITTLAPFVVFNIVFLVPTIFISNAAINFFLIVLFAIHFGGCVGDLFVAYYLIFKNRDKKVIVNDTGPKQTFYVEEVDNGDSIS